MISHAAPSHLVHAILARVRSVLLLCVALLAAATAQAQVACVGDCDSNCEVGISELIRGVNISLGSAPLDGCPAFDVDEDATVAINELIRGVGNALGGCGPECSPGSPSPTPTPTPPSGTVTPGTPDPTAAGTTTPEPTQHGTVTAEPTTSVTPTTGITPLPTSTRTPAEGPMELKGIGVLDSRTLRVSYSNDAERGSALSLGNYQVVQKTQVDVAAVPVFAIRFARTCSNSGVSCNDTMATFCNGPDEPGDEFCKDVPESNPCGAGTCSVEDPRAVVLSTQPHAGRAYRIRVSGVRDTAGRPLRVLSERGEVLNELDYAGKPLDALRHCAAATAAKTAAEDFAFCQVVRCAESGPPCPDGAPCVDLVPDCDGDGLTDDLEVKGWAVSSDGGAEELVTSDPLDADTDNDGLRDGQEFNTSTISTVNTKSDPRSSDTDGDGLDDFLEVALLYISPTDSDHDDDGVADNIEYRNRFSSPDNPDSDGDGIPDATDFGAGGDPNIADMPTFDIAIDSARVRYQGAVLIKRGTETVTEDTKAINQTTELKSGTSRKETNTGVTEWAAKATATFEASAGYPAGFSASASVKAEVSGGVSSRIEVTGDKVKSVAQAYDNTTTAKRAVVFGETVERAISGVTVATDVTLTNTGALAMRVEDLQLRVRMPDPDDATSFRTITTLSAENLSAFDLGPGPQTRTKSLTFSRELTSDLQAIDALMKNPRGVLFEVTNFTIKSPPSDPDSYSEREAIIFNNTGEINIDYAGLQDAERFLVSTNIGSRQAVRDTNGDGINDAERIVYDPEGDFYYPRVTDALEARGIPFTVDLATGQFASIDGLANDPLQRKAWIVLLAEFGDAGPTEPLLRYDPDIRGAEVEVSPGSRVWLVYLQDVDGDLVPSTVEVMYGSSDTDVDGDSDNDGLGDREEIYGSTLVTVTDPLGEEETFTARSNPSLEDSDGDGLTDRDERDRGTAPDRANSDGDQWTDGYEVNVSGTDPLVGACQPQKFTFPMVSQFSTEQNRVIYPRVSETKLGSNQSLCSVTLNAGGHPLRYDGIFQPCRPEDPLVSIVRSGFRDCRIRTCGSTCTRFESMATVPGTCQVYSAFPGGPLCDPSPRPHCSGGIFDVWESGTAFYDIECD